MNLAVEVYRPIQSQKIAVANEQWKTRLHYKQTIILISAALLSIESVFALTCCPRQILGPALKGQKMKGLGTRYFWTRWSKNRSGSNSSARSIVLNPKCTSDSLNQHIPSGPQRSFRLCMRNTEKWILLQGSGMLHIQRKETAEYSPGSCRYV